MSEKVRTSAEDLALISNTLAVRDPERQTIVVGSAAMIAVLNEYGHEAPIGCDDVDVLCPRSFFDRLLADGPHLDDVDKFQVRWPKGRLRERGATNKSIDVYPRDHERELPFTACYSMSDLWYPIDYDSCMPMSVEASGLRCINLANMLHWLVVVGRNKDIQTVERVLPVAIEIGAVTNEGLVVIQNELITSQTLRMDYPERYYARVAGPLV